MFNNIIKVFQDTYSTKGFIPLHEPRFVGNEKKYLNECIDSTFISSVGKYAGELEENTTSCTGAKYSIATSNGNSFAYVADRKSSIDINEQIDSELASL